jgi:hypothetical protein
MGLIGNLFGTPKEHEKEKVEHEVVKTPEFDITQYAKKLALGIPLLVGAIVAALDQFTNVEQTEGIVIGVIGLVAAALLGASLVMAVDLAARAYLTGAGAAEKAEKDSAGKSGDGDPPPGSELVAASPGTIVWLQDDDEPHPLLAIATADGKAGSYLVAAGSKVSRAHDSKDVDAIGGTPKWLSADAITAVKPAKWP